MNTGVITDTFITCLLSDQAGGPEAHRPPPCTRSGARRRNNGRLAGAGQVRHAMMQQLYREPVAAHHDQELPDLRHHAQDRRQSGELADREPRPLDVRVWIDGRKTDLEGVLTGAQFQRDLLVETDAASSPDAVRHLGAVLERALTVDEHPSVVVQDDAAGTDGMS